jgi:hypothetical protein
METWNVFWMTAPTERHMEVAHSVGFGSASRIAGRYDLEIVNAEVATRLIDACVKSREMDEEEKSIWLEVRLSLQGAIRRLADDSAPVVMFTCPSQKVGGGA